MALYSSVHKETCDIGLIGLAVMGQNLVLNINDHGFKVSVYNRTTTKVDEFINNEAKNSRIVGTKTIAEFIDSLSFPRKMILLVKAGKPVDDFIDLLLPLLKAGDIIIDGGNSEYTDSRRRYEELRKINIHFVGSGVSGGEEGARNGPSLMPGGSIEAWQHIKPIFQAISAQVEQSPCCEWIGSDGSGHFVKMVHNGIEYGDIQVICEAYHIMKNVIGLSSNQISQIMKEWNKKELDSYLIEITADILAFKDSDGLPLVEKIRDTAGQKGTGKWTVFSGLEFGIPITLIAEAVFSRCVSSFKNERLKANEVLKGPFPNVVSSPINSKDIIDDLEMAVYASKIISYTQGFMLLREASNQMSWNLNYGSISSIWRGGCIIRSRFLGKIKESFDNDPNLQSLAMSSYFSSELSRCQQSWRKTVCLAITNGIPVPAISSALSFYDGYRCKTLPANLLQAMRDYFGAHTYEHVNDPGKFHHTNWTGTGGRVTSSTYDA